MKIGEKFEKHNVPVVMEINGHTFFPHEIECVGEDDSVITLLVTGSLDGKVVARSYLLCWLRVNAGSTPEEVFWTMMLPRPKEGVRFVIGMDPDPNKRVYWRQGKRGLKMEGFPRRLNDDEDIRSVLLAAKAVGILFIEHPDGKLELWQLRHTPNGEVWCDNNLRRCFEPFDFADWLLENGFLAELVPLVRFRSK